MEKKGLATLMSVPRNINSYASTLKYGSLNVKRTESSNRILKEVLCRTALREKDKKKSCPCA
jgi:hypothetical protein